MKSGYKIFWTDFALKELQATIEYLEENWTEKELRKLALTLEKTLSLIAQNPYLFQKSEIKEDIRRAVILSHNTLYYRFANNQIEILSFFSNSQNPRRRKLK